MDNKTPWNPSKKAIARVTDPLPVPETCRYEECGGQVRILSHEEIYGGRSFGEWPWVYCCDGCGARVGMHPFTNIPLGTLALEPLRKTREACKKPFDQLWKDGHMGRTQAYRWLGKEMGKTIEQCHFGLFEEEDCLLAHRLCEQKLKAFIAKTADDFVLI